MTAQLNKPVTVRMTVELEFECVNSLGDTPMVDKNRLPRFLAHDLVGIFVRSGHDRWRIKGAHVRASGKINPTVLTK